MKKELALFGGAKIISDEMKSEITEAMRWPRISEQTVQKCAAMLREGIISVPHGGIIEEFETRFKQYLGVKHCLLQNNGTSTLHAAFYAVGVRSGDEVLVPAHTWTASVTPIHALGGIPVFCDIDAETLTIDPQDIERKITARTKAICVVHIWGNPCDMDKIMDISKRHNIPVVEDCSHAHGVEYHGKKVGGFGAVGCFSMQGSKALPGGELGAVVTNEDLYLDQIAILGHQGRIPQTVTDEKYKAFEGGLGFKYRPFPIAVQVAMDQLDILEESNRLRRLTVESYNKAFETIPNITLIKQPENTIRACYTYIFLYECDKTGVSAERFEEALAAEGLAVTTMRYKSVHTLPPFNKLPAVVPVTEKLTPKMMMILPFTAASDEKVASYADLYAQGIRKVLSHIDDLK